MLEEAIAVPRRGDEWLERIFIGGLLMIGFFLVFPIFLLYGYYLRVLRAGSEGATALPTFDDWGAMFVDGLKVFAISILYFLVAGMITAFLFFSAVVLVGELDGGSVLGLLLFPIILVVWLLVGYLLPAALTNVAREGSLGAAVDLGTITSAAFTIEYFVAWLLAQIVSIVLGTVAAILTLFIVGIFVSFYVNVVVFYLFGRGFGSALGVETGPDRVPSDARAT